MPVARSLAKTRWATCASMFLIFLPAPAAAELAVSQLVVDLPADEHASDVEVFNDSAERIYVVAEPREIMEAGTLREAPRVVADPEALGLLVSPGRMILEPGQRRTLRIARLGPTGERERVYRVTVKPVVGDVSGPADGLKLLVGYDLLVLARPAAASSKIAVNRTGNNVELINQGNASVELADGQLCEADGKSCRSLPGKRLYAGASWRQSLPAQGAGRYRLRSTVGWSEIRF